MNNNDMVEKYRTIVQSFSKNESFEWWEENSIRPELMAYKVNTGAKKMSFRGHDDTPSVSFLDGLRYYDFGTGEGGDPVTRIMEVTNLPFLEAVKLFLSWFGEDVNIEEYKVKASYVKKSTESKVDPYKPSYLRRMILGRSNPRYKLLLEGLFRGAATQKEIQYAESVLHIGYDEGTEKYVDRLFIPEMDINGIAYGSYKYNRNDSSDTIPKGLIRKNSERVLFGEHMLPKAGKNIIYCEGHTDVIVNIAKKFYAVTTGGATKAIGNNISKLKGKIIYDFPDLDIAGMLGATRRSIEIEAFNKTAKPEDKIKHFVFWWAEWIEIDKIDKSIREGKADKNALMIKDFIKYKNGHAYLNYKHLDIIQSKFLKQKKVSIKNTVSNFKVVFKKNFKNNGYDFIDFYRDENSSEKETLIKFLKQKQKDK